MEENIVLGVHYQQDEDGWRWYQSYDDGNGWKPLVKAFYAKPTEIEARQAFADFRKEVESDTDASIVEVRLN